MLSMRNLFQVIVMFYTFIAMDANAHLAGVTDTSIQIGQRQVKVVYTLPTDSLDELYPYQSVQTVPPEEITRDISHGFKIVNSGAICDLYNSSQQIIERVESTQFSLTYHCNDVLDVLDVYYELFVERFENHKNFARIVMADQYNPVVFSAAQNSTRVPVKETLAQWGKAHTDDFEDDPNVNFSLQAQPSYFPLGIEHILIGIDHLLFLFALLLLPLGFKQLLIMITSFTLAHSITLAMAVFDAVSLPVAWVEAVIALSVVYVGFENLIELRQRANAGWVVPWKRRVIVAFAFGLIHGFGFSFVLREIGLGDQVASALLFFNLGVEAGQIISVAFVFPLLVWLFKRDPSYTFSRVSSLLVILMGGFWMFERIAAEL